MNTIKNIGLIECGSLQKPLYISPESLQGYAVKKVLSTGGANERNINSRYPLAEVVENTRDILDDNSIDLVIVSDPSHDDMGMVGEALEAGKQIRII
ncbi:MAG: hypothetical protein ABI707_15045 [Ferruginibacter sp.]